MKSIDYKNKLISSLDKYSPNHEEYYVNVKKYNHSEDIHFRQGATFAHKDSLVRLTYAVFIDYQSSGTFKFSIESDHSMIFLAPHFVQIEHNELNK